MRNIELIDTSVLDTGSLIKYDRNNEPLLGGGKNKKKFKKSFNK
jgi:hypothetical protein